MSKELPDNPFLWDSEDFYAAIHEAYGEPPPPPIFWPLVPEELRVGKTWARLPDLVPPADPKDTYPS